MTGKGAKHRDRKFEEREREKKETDRWRKNGAFLDKPDPGRCRFNCRTAKENQEAAWYAARQRDESGLMIYESFDEYWNTEGRHDWKRRQA